MCSRYDIEVSEFTGACVEEIHAEASDPAAIADSTLPVEHFERASCGSHQVHLHVSPQISPFMAVANHI